MTLEVWLYLLVSACIPIGILAVACYVTWDDLKLVFGQKLPKHNSR